MKLPPKVINAAVNPGALRVAGLALRPAPAQDLLCLTVEGVVIDAIRQALARYRVSHSLEFEALGHRGHVSEHYRRFGVYTPGTGTALTVTAAMLRPAAAAMTKRMLSMFPAR